MGSDALDMQQRVRGSVEDRYPSDPAALLAELEREREMRRHEASDAAITRRAAELDGNGFESDGYLIRPAATVAGFSTRPTLSTTAWQGSSTSTQAARPTSGSCVGQATPRPRSLPSR
jgi:hypothetical protein